MRGTQASLQGTERSAGGGVGQGSQTEGPVPSGEPGAWHSEAVRAHLSMNERMNGGVECPWTLESELGSCDLMSLSLGSRVCEMWVITGPSSSPDVRST